MRISIPDTVAKKAGLSKEIEAKINAAIKKLDSEYVIYLDSIKGGKLKKNDIFLFFRVFVSSGRVPEVWDK